MVIIVVNCQALSDLSLIFRGAVFGSTGDLLSMFADTLKDRTADRVRRAIPRFTLRFLCAATARVFRGTGSLITF